MARRPHASFYAVFFGAYWAQISVFRSLFSAIATHAVFRCSFGRVFRLNKTCGYVPHFTVPFTVRSECSPSCSANRLHFGNGQRCRAFFFDAGFVFRVFLCVF
jgi:hypothetical protein